MGANARIGGGPPGDATAEVGSLTLGARLGVNAVEGLPEAEGAPVVMQAEQSPNITNVTAVPDATVAEHAVPQLMPPTLLVTIPELLTLTLRVTLLAGVVVPPPAGGCAVNVAPTALAPMTVTAHAPLPLHAPVQPANR